MSRYLLLLAAGLALSPLALANDDVQAAALSQRLAALQLNPATVDLAPLERLQAQQAVDALALQVDVARRGSVKTADAVEHRGFARPVGADDGKNFLGSQVQLDAIDGNQTAKTHAQVVYFK